MIAVSLLPISDLIFLSEQAHRMRAEMTSSSIAEEMQAFDSMTSSIDPFDPLCIDQATYPQTPNHNRHRRVRFIDDEMGCNLVTNTSFRPLTPNEEKSLLYYTRREYIAMRARWKRVLVTAQNKRVSATAPNMAILSHLPTSKNTERVEAGRAA